VSGPLVERVAYPAVHAASGLEHSSVERGDTCLLRLVNSGCKLLVPFGSNSVGGATR